MILSSFKKEATITEIRTHAGTDISGTSFYGLKKAAEKKGLEATAVKCETSQINREMLPCIAHIIPKDNKNADHYVVVRKVKGKRLQIWDPNPEKGKHWVSDDEFQQEWTGNLMFFSKGVDFIKGSEKKFSLWNYVSSLLQHKKLLINVLLCSIIILLLGLLDSLGTKYLYDEVIFSRLEQTLNVLILGLLTVSLLSTALEAVRSVIVRHFSYKSELQLNFSFIRHIFSLPISFFESRKIGEILSRLGDLSQVKNALSSVALSSLIDVLLVIVVGPILFMVNKSIFFVSLVSTFLIGVGSFLFSLYYTKAYLKLKNESAETSSYLVDAINGVNIIKAFNAQNLATSVYENKNMQAVWTGWNVPRVGLVQNISGSIVDILTNTLIMWFGCTAILKSELTLGTMLFLITLSGYLTGPLLRLVNLQTVLQEAFVSAKRVGEILEIEKEVKDDNLIKVDKVRDDIVFEDIVFHYGSRRPVFKGINLTIKAGQSTALVGHSGCGKSTIVKLLLKFYEPDSVQIIINWNSSSDIDAFSLRDTIGYVPQETFLFPDTIANNISMCDESIPLERIIQAARKAGIHEQIVQLPSRYNTKLGENGSGLSGGEKQRIAIARALLKNPSVVILDEATSNLDVTSENRIHELIKTLKKEYVTTIVISHRESTISKCDNVYFLSDGRVVERGVHAKLLKESDTYRKFWEGKYEDN